MSVQQKSERVLVGVDGSEASIEALRYGARLAASFEVPLEAVTTWTFPPLIASYMVQGWSPEGDATSTLDAAIEQAFDGSPPTGLTRSVKSGPAAATLIDESENAGVLVVGERGLGGFSGLQLGSVSAACARHAHCPVLITRSEQSAA